MQALVAIQLVNNQALQFLPVQLPILTTEVFSDMTYEWAALPVFNLCFHFTYGGNDLLTDGQGGTAGGKRSNQQYGEKKWGQGIPPRPHSSFAR